MCYTSYSTVHMHLPLQVESISEVARRLGDMEIWHSDPDFPFQSMHKWKIISNVLLILLQHKLYKNHNIVSGEMYNCEERVRSAAIRK